MSGIYLQLIEAEFDGRHGRGENLGLPPPSIRLNWSRRTRVGAVGRSIDPDDFYLRTKLSIVRELAPAPVDLLVVLSLRGNC